jgi:small-conductance mechanosensitive channel
MTARRLATIALLVSMAAAVLVAAGCGGSKKEQETPADYTNSLCGSLVTWQNSIKSAGSKFKWNVSKSSLQDAKSSISSANSKLKDELQSLGKPPTEGASEARSAVSNLSNELKSNLNDIQSALSGVNSVQDISTAVSAITTSVTAMGSAFSSTTSQLKSLAASDPWRKAFADSSACQQLSSG